MIDAHVHLRDWEQSNAETLEHGLAVAEAAGLDAVFEMPNTDPLILDRTMAEKRIRLADSCKSDVFHGLYLGLTSNPEQIRAAVQTHKDLFPRVVGFKLFAGRSTGNLSVTDEQKQKEIFRILANEKYEGLIAIHAEKESFFHPEFWNPETPATHNDARPPEAETESIKDIIQFAKQSHFKGTVHIAHISAPDSVHFIHKIKKTLPFNITCAITPHHLLLNTDMMKTKENMDLKVNPPIRGKQMAEQLFTLLKKGHIDWIESDHAPHTENNKRTHHASGIPGLPVWPHLIHYLTERGFSQDQIHALCHSNIEKAFHIHVPEKNRKPSFDLFKEYPINAYKDKFSSINSEEHPNE